MAGKIYETMFALGAKINSSFGNAFANAQMQLNRTGRQADQANKRFVNLNNAFNKTAKLMGGLLGAGSVGALFSKSISESSNLEQYRNTLEIVLKDAKKAGETMKWAASFANKTPFETGEVVEATVKLSAYGMEAQKVLPTVGNMAGVMGKSLDQAVEAVADAQTGELERLKEFGITKQMIIDQGNKIMRGKEIVNNKGQITDQAAFNKALFSLMDERFKGGMDKQAKTFKGIMSTITGVFSSSLARMAGMSSDGTIKAGSLFDTVKKKALQVGDILQKWQNDGTIDAIGTKFTKAFNLVVNVSTKVANAFKWAEKNANVLIPLLGGVVAAIGAFKIISTIKGLMDLWRASTIAMTIAQSGLNIAMLANPIGLLVAGIGILVAAGIYLYRNWDTVKAKAIDLWDSISNTFKSGVNTAIKYVNMLIDGLNNIPGVNIPHLKELAIAYNPQSSADFRMIDAGSIGKNANGTNNWRGGLTWVGEQGRELVNLPRGTQIHSNRSVLGLEAALKHSPTNNGSANFSCTVNINVQGSADESAIRTIKEVVSREFQKNMEKFERNRRRLQFSPGR